MTTARKFGVYHRTSNRLGAPHHATIVSVGHGSVDAVTADGTRLLYSPARDITARFTLWGTLILEVRGQAYRFVTGSYAGNQARPFTDAQKQELARAGSGEPDDGQRALNANRNSPAGVATMFGEQHRAFQHTLALAELIEQNGATVSYTTKSYRVSVWSTAAITLPSIAVVVAGVAALAVFIGEWMR